MVRPILCLLSLIWAASGERKVGFFAMFHQNNYRMIFERMETKDYNKNYMVDATARSFKYNRTEIAVNATFEFKFDIGYKLEVVVQTYRFASNEYRLFPMRFGGNFCDFFDADVVSIKYYTLKCGTIKSCPFKKNEVYSTCNFIPDASRFAPNILKGRYMAEFIGMYGRIELFVFRSYIAVAYPEQ